MNKNKIARFLKKNCIKIPFYTALIVGIGFVSNLEQPVQQQDFHIPAGVYEVWAATVQIEPTEDDAENVEGLEMNTEEMIIAACEEYGIDHEIPVAISRLETGHWTSDAYIYGNNVGGMSVNEVPLSYETLTEGVDAFVKNLTYNYFEEGLDTPEEIGQKYCPINPEWAEVVRGLM